MGKKDFCSAVGCAHDRSRGAICGFFKFPAISSKLNNWLEKVDRLQVDDDKLIPWTPKKSSRLCSCHFPDKKAGSGPSIFTEVSYNLEEAIRKGLKISGSLHNTSGPLPEIIKTPKTPRVRKRPASSGTPKKTEGDDDSGEPASKTPKLKVRLPAWKQKKVKADEAKEEEDEETAKLPPKKKATKKAQKAAEAENAAKSKANGKAKKTPQKAAGAGAGGAKGKKGKKKKVSETSEGASQDESMNTEGGEGEKPVEDEANGGTDAVKKSGGVEGKAIEGGRKVPERKNSATCSSTAAVQELLLSCQSVGKDKEGDAEDEDESEEDGREDEEGKGRKEESDESEGGGEDDDEGQDEGRKEEADDCDGGEEQNEGGKEEADECEEDGGKKEESDEGEEIGVVENTEASVGE